MLGTANVSCTSAATPLSGFLHDFGLVASTAAADAIGVHLVCYVASYLFYRGVYSAGNYRGGGQLQIGRLNSYLAQDEEFSRTTLPFLASVAKHISDLFPKVCFLVAVHMIVNCIDVLVQIVVSSVIAFSVWAASGTETHDEIPPLGAFAENSSTLFDGCKLFWDNSSKTEEVVAQLGQVAFKCAGHASPGILRTGAEAEGPPDLLRFHAKDHERLLAADA